LWSEEFLRLQRGIETASIPNIKGIHLDLQDGPILETIDKNIEAILIQLDKMPVSKGISVHSSTCMQIVQLSIQTKNPNEQIEKLLSQLNYVVCKDQIEVTFQDDPFWNDLKELFDAQLYLERFFGQLQPHLHIRFRVELIVPLTQNKATMERYLRIVSHFQKYATAYDIRYFLVEAFDRKSDPSNNNGWWGIQNYTDLTDPQSYVEKESGKIVNLF